MNTPKLLAAIIGLQIVSLATQFLGQPTIIAPAQAQMPDAGGQRSVMIDELKGIRAELKTLNTSTTATSARVDKVVALLENGKLQVRATSPDENKRPTGK